MSIAFNPYVTTNAAGSFGTSSSGGVQGTAYDSPNARYNLSNGVWATTNTLPLYGGVGVSELLSSLLITAPASNLGPVATFATSLTAGASGQLTGWSVFDQNYSGVNSPQSPVPLVGAGSTFNHYRLGSGARLWLAMDPALISLESGPISTQVSWDFSTNQRIIKGIAAYAAETLSTGNTYTSSTGIISLVFGTAPFGASIGSGANGVFVTISGLAGSGASQLNGTWAVTGTSSSGTVVTLQAPTGLGSITITDSTGTLVAGGGYLPINILDLSPGDGVGVTYTSSTGFYTWNRAAYLALVQI